MNKLKKLLLISSALLLSTANNAFAGSASGSIAVTGAVVGTCTVSAADMGLSTLNQGSTTVGTSLVTVNCSDGITWTVRNNASSNGNLCLTGVSCTGNAAISFPLTVASGAATHTEGTFLSAGTGYLSALSTGSAQTGTITGTAASATGKTAGNYAATITLALTFP